MHPFQFSISYLLRVIKKHGPTSLNKNFEFDEWAKDGFMNRPGLEPWFKLPDKDSKDKEAWEMHSLRHRFYQKSWQQPPSF